MIIELFTGLLDSLVGRPDGTLAGAETGLAVATLNCPAVSPGNIAAAAMGRDSLKLRRAERNY